MKRITPLHLFSLKEIFATALLISMGVSSYGTTNTATVSYGTWSTGANWSLGHIPISGEDIIIPSGKSIVYDISVTLGSGGSLTINGALCGVFPMPFTISCGCYFTCNGLMSGNVINVADGVINSGGMVYVLDTFIYTPCSTGFNNLGSIINGQPSSCYPTVISENDFAARTSIFPSPFDTDLNVTVGENSSSEIILYDIFSRELLYHRFSTSAVLNTEQLAKGIYFYKVRNRNGVIKQGKIVKE